MEVTGFDYEIISNVSYMEMKPKFEAILKNTWRNSVVSIIEHIDNEKIWIFFAENEGMSQEDTGYELNEKGEGCFSIIVNRAPVVDRVYAVIDSKREISREIRLTQTDLWWYSLILPDTIEDNSFSKHIYDTVRTILSKGILDDSVKALNQRAVQFYI